MPLSLQYTKDSGETFEQQVGLDVEDYTSNGTICNYFWVVKDSKDTVYVFCGSTTEFIPAKIIKITSAGVKTVGTLLNLDGGINNTGYVGSANTMHTLSLSRDESLLFVNCSTNNASFQVLQSISTNFASGNITPNILIGGASAMWYAIYQDRYIWVASGTMKIYDYTTKVSLDSDGVAIVASLAFCADYNNTSVIAYSISANTLSKLSFNTVDTITKTDYTITNMFTNAKQMLIDKWGDLVIITNTGTASQLLKYTNVGVEKDVLTLGGSFYNLNTDKDGNYYYSNALGTYKITANTAQGQAFSGVGVKIRENGMITYGSNITGYNPAVFGTQE